MEEDLDVMEHLISPWKFWDAAMELQTFKIIIFINSLLNMKIPFLLKNMILSLILIMEITKIYHFYITCRFEQNISIDG